MMKIFTSIFIWIVFIPGYTQSLPVRENKTDDRSLKQGPWIYYYDHEWNLLPDSSQAKFYRILNYLDSQPKGKVSDYYRNGKLQMTADSIIQENPELYHGNVFYYTPEERIHLVEHYDNGVMDTLQTIQIFETLIKQYQEEIPNHLDLAQTANDLAFLYRETQKYELAAKYYELCLEIRETKLGRNHLLYAHSCAKLGWVYLKQNRLKEAEGLFIQSMVVYEKLLGKDSERYKVSRDHLAFIYRHTNREDMAKELYR